jgi:hypothetical protein
VSRFENPAQFDNASYPDAALGRSTLKTILLLTALLAYVVGSAFLYPIVASSVAESVSEGNDPALLPFVAP